VASRIEDYALIGDCETAALLALDGSIDWLCWPTFSSGACFAALLGTPDNGRWQIAPAGEVSRVARKYQPHTLIVETVFETAEGQVTLIDFMPVRVQNSDVVRMVRGDRGTVAMHMELALRFDYGRTVPWVTSHPSGMQAIAGPDLVMLRTPVRLQGEGLKTVSDFEVSAGESVSFVLTHGISHQHPPRAIDPDQALKDTQRYWEEWTGQCTATGLYTEAVERSLITLKALTYLPTGGIVAAVTTSLPESLGGQRNWDYRYCWLRDATFTLLALMNGGYFEEAQAWLTWLLRAIAGSPEQVQTLYGLSGERQIVEWEIPWLPGYANSMPVRVGNAAAGQVQLDIYGELLDAFFHAQQGLDHHRRVDFKLQAALVNHLEDIWQEPDEGIWEVRGGPRQFTYSKMMAWVAFDRAIRLAQQLGYHAPVDRWLRTRDAIHEQVCRLAYDAELGSFVQAYGSKELDAALLLMPLVGFLPPEDARVRGTVEAIEKRLMPDGLVLRYNSARVDDGLPPGEGVFLACSFWMVSALKSIGRIEDARSLFDKLLALRNDVGLLAEEYDSVLGRQVGNFPQAFSHIALVNAAFDLEDASSCRRRSTQSTSHQRAQGIEPASQHPTEKAGG
jgi:GH15 family glucan-1,4-alpha-glucosidase